MSNDGNAAKNNRSHPPAQLDFDDAIAVGESVYAHSNSRSPFAHDTLQKNDEDVYAYDGRELDLYTGDVRFSGTATRIVFRNEENSYTVLELESEGDNNTLSVSFDHLCGDMVEGEGVWRFHSLYGPQIEVRTIFRKEPEGKKINDILLQAP